MLSYLERTDLSYLQNFGKKKVYLNLAFSFFPLLSCTFRTKSGGKAQCNPLEAIPTANLVRLSLAGYSLQMCKSEHDYFQSKATMWFPPNTIARNAYTEKASGKPPFSQSRKSKPHTSPHTQVNQTISTSDMAHAHSDIIIYHYLFFFFPSIQTDIQTKQVIDAGAARFISGGRIPL